MARHRSPRGRRTIARSSVPVLVAAARSGGVGRHSLTTRVTPNRVVSAAAEAFRPAAPVATASATTCMIGAADAEPRTTPLLVVAVVATGGVLAAAGHALSPPAALPDLGDDLAALTAGVGRVVETLGEPRDATSGKADAGQADGARIAALVPPAVPAVEQAHARAAAAPRDAVLAGAPIGQVATAAVSGSSLATAAQQASLAARKVVDEAEASRVAAASDARRAVQASGAATGGLQMLAGRVSSGFGARNGSVHMGLDIAAPIGTPIHVPLAGTVISSGPASGFGLWVRVRHADGTITVYGHINRSLVSVGQHVSAGQVIAEVGNRGESTGPHLHIEVTTPAGTKIDPRPWLDEHGIRYT